MRWDGVDEQPRSHAVMKGLATEVEVKRMVSVRWSSQTGNLGHGYRNVLHGTAASFLIHPVSSQRVADSIQNIRSV